MKKYINKVNNLLKDLEKKPNFDIVKISLAVLIVSLLIGFSSGLLFREIRLNLLANQQKYQKVQEKQKLNSFFEQFSQKSSANLSLPKKAK